MDKQFNTICMIGLGYIGLPTAAAFASNGIKVVGVDINQRAVDTINRGEIHIVEPELDVAVRAAVNEGNLRATTKPEPADAFLIAVPTPFKKDTEAGDIPSPDLSYIQAASESIAPVLKQGDLVILESTSPVGATEQMAEWLAQARPDLSFPQAVGEGSDIRVAHCPERVLPGKVMQELITNDRVIGGMTTKCANEASSLYRTFVTGECVVASNPRLAEMAKLTENSFRDVNIAFANELSIICDEQEIDVWELIRLANRHPRVNILQPGPGVGGHCIAVDPWFIVSSSPNSAQLIRQSRIVNDSKPSWVIGKVKTAIDQLLLDDPTLLPSDVVVGCYGLSFKPDIDDLRESPSLEIVRSISRFHTGTVFAVEPNLPEYKDEDSLFEMRQLSDSEAHIKLFLVKHSQFIKCYQELTTAGVVIDVCGIE